MLDSYLETSETPPSTMARSTIALVAKGAIRAMGVALSVPLKDADIVSKPLAQWQSLSLVSCFAL